jgi:hypothetical protein
MKKSSIAFVVAILLSVSQVGAFPDVETTNPYYLATTYLTEKGIIQGYEDGSFGIDKPINRAEALKIILVAADKKLKEDFAGKFTDVPKEAWFSKYVETAAEMEIVSGDGATGNFVPARQVNKAEFLKMVFKTFEINPADYEKVLDIIPSDVSADAWFAPYLKFAAKFKIIDLDAEEKAFPAKALSRGEAVDILFKTLNKGRGLDPQVLLNLAEKHLINTVNLLETGDLLNAGLNVGVAEKTMIILNNFLPDNLTVKSSTKIADSIKNLVGAYVSGSNGQVDSVLTASGNAWNLADEAEKINPEQTTGITVKIKDLAHSIAEKARNIKDAPPVEEESPKE